MGELEYEITELYNVLIRLDSPKIRPFARLPCRRVKLGAIVLRQQLADFVLSGRAQGRFRKKAKAGVLRVSSGTKSPSLI